MLMLILAVLITFLNNWHAVTTGITKITNLNFSWNIEAEVQAKEKQARKTVKKGTVIGLFYEQRKKKG